MSLPCEPFLRSSRPYFLSALIRFVVFLGTETVSIGQSDPLEAKTNDNVSQVSLLTLASFLDFLMGGSWRFFL